jgi:serine/threonine-protein kinase
MIGTTIGNYRIVEKLGAGGMGEVYRAIDTVLEREVALKSLHPFLTQDAGRLERFRSEAITLAKLNHPNIAILHSFFAHNDVHYMVMEYVQGENFESLIRRFGRVPLRNTLEMFTDALKGFEHAHAKNVIHRDIKPANLMLNSEGVVKITDFGIARVVGGERLTQAGKLIGTLEYMSPEQVRGQEQDARSDVYSLGILLYEMVAGQVPFSSESDFEIMRSHLEVSPRSLRDLSADVPAEIEAIIAKALAKDPMQRFASAREFRAALEPLLAATPLAAPQIVPQIRATREATMADLAASPATPPAAFVQPTTPATAIASPPPTRADVPAAKNGATPSWLKPRVAIAGALALLLVVGLSAAAMRFRSAPDIPKMNDVVTNDVVLTDRDADDDESTPPKTPKSSAEMPVLPPVNIEQPEPKITPLPVVKSAAPRKTPPKTAPRPTTVKQNTAAKPAVRRSRTATPVARPRVRRKVRPVRRNLAPKRRSIVRRSTPVRRKRARSSGGGGEAALRAAIKGG